VEPWFPIEETRLVVRDALGWIVVLTAFWVTSHYALWLGVPAAQTQNVEWLEGYVMVGSLAVLGIRLMMYLWKVTGAQKHALIIAA
jgi:hypothetical protein